MDKIKNFQDHLDVNFKGFTNQLNKSIKPLRSKYNKDNSMNSGIMGESAGSSCLVGDDDQTHQNIKNHIFNDIHNEVNHPSC